MWRDDHETKQKRKFSSVKPPLVEGSSPAPSPPTEGEKGAEKAEAQYLSANCVLFTYYSGDISSVVDEHFARALSQAAYAAPAPPEAKGSSAPLHSSKEVLFGEAPLSRGQQPRPLPPYGRGEGGRESGGAVPLGQLRPLHLLQRRHLQCGGRALRPGPQSGGLRGPCTPRGQRLFRPSPLIQR
ncbi:uncharacterized protein TNIN_405271 [Trichonephila inaurata madagascariensis]|uniref:Transcription cofactor vestigial-like protein 2 n=1 Tax=Trichonephila inaurata madagascariensis TaxID=2747483 RepID=A0A8X6XH89_9ARAC|nr:uncharacterized protein TNIN_405271 [Trichonephila inaurata madagascariensis]